jgi:antibiotic biosynthesis monooxygenase (ABM) superfamily enzyme
MITYVLKYDILADKFDAYAKWAPDALSRLSSRPGVTGARIYATIAGLTNTTLLFEFADLAAFEAWYATPEVQSVFSQARAFLGFLQTEIWGPSPIQGASTGQAAA